MRSPRHLSEGSKEKLATALKGARTKAQYQLVLCLWLRAALEMNASDVALALGISVQGVWHIWSRYLHQGEAMFKQMGKGGRRHEYLSPKAERDFLKQLLCRTNVGQTTLNSRSIQEAFEKLVGHPVSISTIHRLLKRHNWRAVDRSQIRLPEGWAPSGF